MRETLLVAPTLALIAVLLFTSRTNRVRETQFLARIDTVSRAYRATEVEPDSVIWPGDLLPEAKLVRSTGDTVELRELSAQYRYFYFYKEDCPACSLLDPIWYDGGNRADEIAHIAYSSSTQQIARGGKNHFAWLTDPVHRTVRRVRSTPTMLIADDAGRVVSVVSGYQQIMHLTKRFGLLNPDHVDSSFARSKALRQLRIRSTADR